MNINTNTHIIPISKLSTSGLDELKKEGRMLREAILRKHERQKEEGHVDKSFYTTNIVDLFSFYIPRPDLLFDRYSGLKQLRCYRIFPSLDPSLYHTNCFVYALE